MILIVDLSRVYPRGFVHDSRHGVPISGASVGLRDPITKRYLAETISHPNGYFSFEEYKPPKGYENSSLLEVIVGSERVTILGDDVHVDVPQPWNREPRAPWYRRLWGL